MKPLFVRGLSGPERHALQAGLRSSDGFRVRRCHILLASARGDTAPIIAKAIGCSPQAVRNVLRGFETRGLAVLSMQSRRPHAAAKVFDAERSGRLKALLHQSPRQFGKARSTWTLALAAEVCLEQGVTAERVSLETIRDALKRLGVGWRRAKRWITSPDPQYALKNVWPAPFASGFRRTATDRSASTYPASEPGSRPRWRSARPGPHKTHAVACRFLSQADEARIDRQAIFIMPPANIREAGRRRCAAAGLIPSISSPRPAPVGSGCRA